jgi:hypothetical protein
MTTDDPPASEPDELAPDDAGDGVGPAVGNVLGFSLMFRERRALLALNRRSLGTGVRLREYEAVLPGVRFPLRGPLNATKFRNRRPRVVAAALAIEDRALRPWLRERLVGQELLGLRISDIELDLRRELPEAARARPCLMIHAEVANAPNGGHVWLLAAFDIEPVHRLLVLRPCRLWLVGHLPQLAGQERPDDASVDRHGRDNSARRLWRAVARRLAGAAVGGVATGIVAGDDGSLTIDAARMAMTRPFASVGWKAPNLEGCAVETLSLSRRGVTIELRGPLTETEPGEEQEFGEGGSTWISQPPASDAARMAVAPEPGEPGLLDEPIGRGLDHARELLRASAGERGDIGPALERLASLSDALREFPAAHLALVRWRVRLSRFLDRVDCLAAAHEWLDLQPSAAEPRRLIAVLLAASDRAQDLARLLAAECRQPHPPLVQARLELAVASLLIDRLDDARSALALVGPLTQRVREQIDSHRDRRGTRRPSEREGDGREPRRGDRTGGGPVRDFVPNGGGQPNGLH